MADTPKDVVQKRIEASQPQTSWFARIIQYFCRI
jgi:hypothetical protein